MGGGAKRSYRVIDWRRKMSDNIAYALLTYTALQIFMTMGALHSKSGSLLPYFALVVLVVAIIVGLSVYRSSKPAAVVIPAGASDVGVARSS